MAPNACTCFLTVGNKNNTQSFGIKSSPSIFYTKKNVWCLPQLLASYGANPKTLSTRLARYNISLSLSPSLPSNMDVFRLPYQNSGRFKPHRRLPDQFPPFSAPPVLHVRLGPERTVLGNGGKTGSAHATRWHSFSWRVSNCNHTSVQHPVWLRTDVHHYQQGVRPV